MTEQLFVKPSQSSDLSKNLKTWHKELQAALSLKKIASSDIGLAALSPLKNSKRSSTRLQDTEADFCWQLLLNLLLWRGCEISLQPLISLSLAQVRNFADLQNLWQELAAQPLVALVDLEVIASCHEKILVEIIQAIGQIPATELAAEFLADLSPQFSSLNGRNLRKRTGAFYTPPVIAADIVEETLNKLDLAQATVLDPACGGGIFLLNALDFVTTTTKKSAAQVLNQLYGLDINPMARDLCLVSLLLKASQIDQTLLSKTVLGEMSHHIQTGNALIGKARFEFLDLNDKALPTKDLETMQNEALVALPIFNAPSDGLELRKQSPFHWQTRYPEVFKNGGFDAIIGNPPYVGFNDYSGLEKAYFAYAYPEVYNLKADLLYYFIYRGVDLLKAGGRLGFIVSRFWREAAFAARLRQWLAAKVTLEGLCDLKEDNLFDDVTIDTCLLFLCKCPPPPDHTFQIFATFQEFQNRTKLSTLPQRELNKAPWAWLQRPLPLTNLLEKIQAQSVRLGEVASCRTGVQTGYDRAFFVGIRDELAAEIEPEVLRPALKNSDIAFQSENAARASFNWAGHLHLIYPPTNLNTEQCREQFPNLFAYLERYKTQLQKRLRYDKTFEFWQLQWPREPELFTTKPKLITPYKAPRNTFAVDKTGFFFSTDIISIIFTAKSTFAENLEVTAANFLSSRLSTFQFRSYCKQMSGGQYDYYANPVKQLLLPANLFAENLDQSIVDLAAPDLTAKERDEIVWHLYDLTPTEVDAVLSLIYI